MERFSNAWVLLSAIAQKFSSFSFVADAAEWIRPQHHVQRSRPNHHICAPCTPPSADHWYRLRTATSEEAKDSLHQSSTNQPQRAGRDVWCMCMALFKFCADANFLSSVMCLKEDYLVEVDCATLNLSKCFRGFWSHGHRLEVIRCGLVLLLEDSQSVRFE